MGALFGFARLRHLLVVLLLMIMLFIHHLAPENNQAMSPENRAEAELVLPTSRNPLDQSAIEGRGKSV